MTLPDCLACDDDATTLLVYNVVLTAVPLQGLCDGLVDLTQLICQVTECMTRRYTNHAWYKRSLMSPNSTVGIVVNAKKRSTLRRNYYIPSSSVIGAIMASLAFTAGVFIGLCFGLELSCAASLNGLIDSSRKDDKKLMTYSDTPGWDDKILNVDKPISRNRTSGKDVRQIELSKITISEYKQPRNITDYFKGIYWNPSLLKHCPMGISSAGHSNWRQKASEMRIVKMEEGCGRMQNRLLTFQDGTKACARYRVNMDQLQGEIYSYYLARLLNISNVLPTFLHVVSSKAPQWSTIHLDLVNSRWGNDRPVILTEWLDNLAPAYIPSEFKRKDKSAIIYSNSRPLLHKSEQELCELVQWSDLVVFDYLTANIDRVVNNMFNQQWNSNMLNQPAHNLNRHSKSEDLVFLDNESGLFHGFRLLDKYEPFHKSLLESVCVFRQSTVDTIKSLFESGDIGERLHTLFEESEVHHKSIPFLPNKNIKVLKSRVETVYNHMRTCTSV